MHYTTHSAEETEALAAQLLPEILSKKIVQLSGNLGSGKTTFVKGLAKALGIVEMIKSPTYIYVQHYTFHMSNEEGKTTVSKLAHFDLYRLPEISQNADQTAASIGLEQAINDPHALVVIEWPERLPTPIGMMITVEKHESSHLITIR